MGKDMVNHPAHYADNCSMECFDAMKIAFGMDNVLKYCEITAFKYLWRHKSKGGEEDVRKALWYLERAKGLVDKEYAILMDDQLHALLVQAQNEIDKYRGKKK